MISVILLIFTLLLVVIGGICGFCRGILKEGVRTALWAVLFFASLFVIPLISDAVFDFVFQKMSLDAVTVEQLIEQYLNQVDYLKVEPALVNSLAALVRSLVAPVLAIVLFWATGLVSFILYLIISVFLKKVTENQNIILKAAGAVLGIIVALFAGSFTIFPVMTVESAISEGDYDLALQEEFEEVTMITNIYEGSAASKIYQYTGMELTGKAVHNVAISKTVEAQGNVWTELPAIIRLGNEGWKIYNAFSDESAASTMSMQKQIPNVAEAFFALNFISDETQVSLLQDVKASVKDSLGESTASEIIDWLEIQNKEQFVNDITAYGKVYDVLKQDGILDALLEESTMPHLEEKTVNAVLDALYELSNSDVVVPKALNYLYTSALDNIDLPIELTGIEWTEESKEELNEVISIVYEYSDKLENKDTITEEEKDELLGKLEELKDNNIIDNEKLEELMDMYKNQ